MCVCIVCFLVHTDYRHASSLSCTCTIPRSLGPPALPRTPTPGSTHQGKDLELHESAWDLLFQGFDAQGKKKTHLERRPCPNHVPCPILEHTCQFHGCVMGCRTASDEWVRKPRSNKRFFIQQSELGTQMGRQQQQIIHISLK